MNSSTRRNLRTLKSVQPEFKHAEESESGQIELKHAEGPEEP